MPVHNTMTAGALAVCVLIFCSCTQTRSVIYDPSSEILAEPPAGMNEALQLVPVETGHEAACWRIDLEPIVKAGGATVAKAMLRLSAAEETFALDEDGKVASGQMCDAAIMNVNCAYVPDGIKTIGKEDGRGDWTQEGVVLLEPRMTKSDKELWDEELTFGSELTGMGSWVSTLVGGGGHYGTKFTVYPIELAFRFHCYASAYLTDRVEGGLFSRGKAPEMAYDTIDVHNPVMEVRWPANQGWLDIDVTDWINAELSVDQSISIYLRAYTHDGLAKLQDQSDGPYSVYHFRRLQVQPETCRLYVKVK